MRVWSSTSRMRPFPWGLPQFNKDHNGARKVYLVQYRLGGRKGQDSQKCSIILDKLSRARLTAPRVTPLGIPQREEIEFREHRAREVWP